MYTNIKFHKGPIGDKLVLDQWYGSITVLCNKSRYNTRRIKPYTPDTNVEDINHEKYL